MFRKRKIKKVASQIFLQNKDCNYIGEKVEVFFIINFSWFSSKLNYVSIVETIYIFHCYG